MRHKQQPPPDPFRTRETHGTGARCLARSARDKTLAALLLLGQIVSGESRADLAEGLDAAAKRDWPRALTAFQGAAERGNSNAQVNLGNLYLRGLGVPQDDQVAFSWYERAALQGNAIAEAKLAVLYYHGLGTPENRPRAAEWFQKAADQGDPHAALVLGEMKLAGDGIPRNPVEAYLWFSIADELGNEEAAVPRATLARELSSTDIHHALDRLTLWRDSYQQRLDKAARRPRAPVPASPPKPAAKDEAKTSKASPPRAKPKNSKKKAPGLKPLKPPPGG